METRPFSNYSPLRGTNEEAPERGIISRWISTRTYNFWWTLGSISAFMILATVFVTHSYVEAERPANLLMAESPIPFPPITPDRDDLSRLFNRKWPLPDSSWRNNENMQDRQRLETLELVQVIFRHGERNPLDSLGPFYSNDIEQFPGGWGQLTQRGQEQAFQLGQYLRQRYDGFLDQEYKRDQFFALSSGIDRTIITLISVLKGVYPSNYTSIDMSKSPQGGQLVPFRTLDPTKDNLIQYTMACPRFSALFKNAWSQVETIQQFETDHKNLLDMINKETGREAKSWNDIKDSVIDYMRVLMEQKKPLPKWVTKEMLDGMEVYITRRISVSLASPELKRFRSPIVQKLIDNMAEKVRDHNDNKMLLISGHDTTITTILKVLGVHVNSMPPYTSSLMFELHKNSSYDDHHVELYFRYTRGLEWREPLKMELPHCPSPCFLKQLEELMSPLYIQDYQGACQNSGSSQVNSKPFTFFVTAVILGMVSKFSSLVSIN